MSRIDLDDARMGSTPTPTIRRPNQQGAPQSAGRCRCAYRARAWTGRGRAVDARATIGRPVPPTPTPWRRWAHPSRHLVQARSYPSCPIQASRVPCPRRADSVGRGCACIASAVDAKPLDRSRRRQEVPYGVSIIVGRMACLCMCDAIQPAASTVEGWWVARVPDGSAANCTCRSCS